MFYLKLKSDSELVSIVCSGALVVVCEGCNELQSSGIDLISALDGARIFRASRADIEVIESFHVCSADNFKASQQGNESLFDSCGRILVLSCGVGVQQISSYFPKKDVYPLCDTFLLPGFQGATPSEFDCALCGDCHLNKTGAICPITSCAKSLINGGCGGEKDGKCEVDSEMECGWARINKRINIQSSIIESGKWKNTGRCRAIEI
ncbi:MAG: methylenetetrahydrofolate reductase C-terminal domain-containing protein [Oscillospiraceae bacterium]|nr:methylenetetrahydrofolate reductase C-terminal domain-containing protein [Oscillospiraceae bacterium]